MLKEIHLKLIFYLIFIIKLFECVHLFDHVDALAYHLLLPRYLVEVGFAETFRTFFIGLQAGYFEFLYVLPISIFGNTATSQILCQMMHYLAGLGLLSYLATKSLKNKRLAYLLAIAFLTINAAPSVFLYAKNDGVVASLSFLLFLIINKQIASHSKYRSAYIGLLLGLIPGVKLTGLFPALILFFFYFFKSKNQIKTFLLSMLIALLAFAPICFLKWFYTGNPLFPALLNLIPTSLPPEIIDTYTNFTKSKISAQTFFIGFKGLFYAKLILLSTPLLLIFSVKRKNIPVSFLLGICIYLLYAAINGGNISERFYFSAFFLLLHGFFCMIENLDIRWRFYLPVLFVFVLVDSKLDLSIKRIKNSIVFSKLNQKEFISKNIPLTNLWRKIEISSANDYTYVYTDLLYMGFYSPKNIRLEQWRMDINAMLAKKDSEKFKARYFYLILNKTLSDISSPLIQGYNQIDEVQDYVVFKREIN